MTCPIKVIVSNRVPSGTGGYFFSGPVGPEKCALCGTDHGYVKPDDELSFDTEFLARGHAVVRFRVSQARQPVYAEALDTKLETLRRSMRDLYGIEPKGDQ
jgi:hypothetical protein